MAFFEAEFPRTLSYKGVGGPAFNTFLVDVASGAEQRNRNWSAARGRWTVSLITPVGLVGQPFVDALETFFLMVGGRADPFRFFDHLSFQATNQPVAAIYGGGVQLQRVYSLGGREYVRTITKPIGPPAIDYQGNTLAATVSLKTSGGSTRDPMSYTVDYTTGIITGAATDTDTASFQYHIPVRLDADELQLQVEDSNVAGGNPIVSWNSLALVEVFPPNY